MSMNPLIYRKRFTPVEVDETFELPEEVNPVVPDQSPNNEKFYDNHGMVLSDIAILFKAVESQNNELVQSISSRFSQNGDPSFLDPNMSEDEMFNSTESRYAQTPTEVYNQAGYINSVSSDADVSSQSDDSGKIQFDATDNTSTDS